MKANILTALICVAVMNTAEYRKVDINVEPVEIIGVVELSSVINDIILQDTLDHVEGFER